MAKRISSQRIKKDRLYTYETAAASLKVTPATVRSWRKVGLQVMSERKPHYILGEALIEFLARRSIRKSIKMASDQMYCLSCRMPRRPLGAMLDYVPNGDAKGRLVGLCEACERPIQRFSSKADLVGLSEVFEIATKVDSQA
ncbi:MerR family transcriptional regulator [Actibacterium pelagium]|uniref:Helix-turn-helix domain-containing protein n=1 Tax=Actibacterium pelagium TaxID=2029103 RepID=A0A917EKS3_9RHOB|nr:helix-turn-helix domain-containing protein [Actibacterium pelagium]GGE58004.1 hypothetical protein GCM10011517_27260 [Actibacterium pelagium]